MTTSLQQGFNAVKKSGVDYYKAYAYNSPLVMTDVRARELKLLGRILCKTIAHMLDQYNKFLHIIPRDEKELRILEICSRYPFHVGTFRADFVIDQAGSIKIIEMNARQPLNGLFVAGFSQEIALHQAEGLNIKGIIDLYSGLFNYLERYIGDAKHICVIFGNYPPAEMRYYPSIFEKAGIKCHLITLEELPQKLHLLRDAWVILQGIASDFRYLPLEIIEALAECNSHNALNVSLYSGDKRFFYALNHPGFLESFLATQELGLLKKYITPTYLFGTSPELWDEAFNDKEKYILKHHWKSRGEDVYAGYSTDNTTWKNLFSSKKLDQMVLQPYVTQKKYQGFVGDEPRNDFLTGTLLYFNDEFFGPGMYRAHSVPVFTVKVDSRRIAQLVAAVESDPLPGFNYIT